MGSVQRFQAERAAYVRAERSAGGRTQCENPELVRVAGAQAV